METGPPPLAKRRPLVARGWPGGGLVQRTKPYDCEDHDFEEGGGPTGWPSSMTALSDRLNVGQGLSLCLSDLLLDWSQPACLHDRVVRIFEHNFFKDIVRSLNREGSRRDHDDYKNDD